MPDIETKFDPRKGEFRSLITFDRLWTNPFRRIVSLLVYILGTIAFLSLINIFLKFYEGFTFPQALIFPAILLLAISLPFDLFHKDATKWYTSRKISQFQNGQNICDFFAFDLAKASYPILMKNDGDVARLFLALLHTNDASFMLLRLGIGSQQFGELLEHYNGNLGPGECASKAFEIAKARGSENVSVGDMFLAIFKYDSFFQEILNILKLEYGDIEHITQWLERIKEEIKTQNRFLSLNKFHFDGGIGKDWAFGYTTYLKYFSSDITEIIKSRGLNLEIIGRQKEIAQIKEALISNSGSNVLIVGEPGVGKRSTVLGFVKDVVKGQTGTSLDHRHIIQIDIDALLSGVSDPGEITARVTTIFAEASHAGNVIVYIENFQNLLVGGDAVGKIDISSVILPILESGSVAIMGTCDVANYNQFIVPNTALNQRFTRINIEEPAENEMVAIMEDVVYKIEVETNCVISYAAIKETLSLADKYLINMPNPEKSINLLDRAAASCASKRGKTIIMPNDVADYVAEKFNVPAGDAKEEERGKLLRLEEEMHKSVIGQEPAIAAIANAMRRSRAGVENSKKPIGSFLFLGPTGVGKTETAKALSHVYFGGENKMIRFDMSEYQNEEDIYRFIGSNIRGENIPGALTTAVRENPFSLVLFDEIEKAYKDILDLFLQILDEGFVTDGSGRKVSFANSIIIATSNAGSELIRESISGGHDYEIIKQDLINYLQEKGIYRPEFLNRFTTVAVFAPLSEPQIQQVAGLMIEKLQGDIYKNKGIKIEIDPKILPVLAHMGFDPQMGARPMARTIQEKVEDMLATKILSGELKRGDEFLVTQQEIS